MHRFSDGNPIIPFVYTLAAAGVAAFSLHPAVLLLAVAGAIACHIADGAPRRFHAVAAGLFVAAAAVNPILSQNGVTVLFFVGDRAVTAEAILYGLAAAGMIAATLYRFASLTRVLTADRLLYLTGRLSPRFSLVVSMALRFVPLFVRRAAAVKEAQTALGLYREDRLFPRLVGGVRVFSVLLTWGLENGIVTADSMTARGYGACPRRTSYARIRFTRRDGIRLALVLLLAAGAALPLLAGALDFAYYPAVTAATASPLAIVGLISYGILVFLPLLIDGKEYLTWKYCVSKI